MTTDGFRAPSGVDTSILSPARLYDYYLGGKDYYEADRKAAEHLVAALPELPGATRLNRVFHQRSIAMLAGRGTTQFLDVGCGLPSSDNTHSIARQVVPDARVVYVDHDPVVLAHARSQLIDDSTTTVVKADVRHPADLLAAVAETRLIDFARPIGLSATTVFNWVSDDDDPAGIVAELAAAFAPGSSVSIAQITTDGVLADKVAAFDKFYDNTTERLYFRTKAEFETFYTRAGLDIVPPFDGASAEACRLGDWNPPELTALPESIHTHMPSPIAGTAASRLAYVAVGIVPEGPRA
jgi:SAM-dependent methyltransferase